MSVLRFLVDYERKGSPARKMRARRFRLFTSLLSAVPRPVRILDVGGTEVFWRTMGLAEALDVEVTTINLDLPGSPVGSRIISLQGDARDLSRFGDKSFEVVFSNSLIEHVGGLDDQRRVANEIRRVGRAYFVQTPNRDFPLEPHFLFPFFQHLPVDVRVALLTRFDLGWISRTGDAIEARRIVESIQLLYRDRFRRLFPGATFWEERMLGLVKSFVAYAGFPERGSTQGWTNGVPASNRAFAGRV